MQILVTDKRQTGRKSVVHVFCLLKFARAAGGAKAPQTGRLNNERRRRGGGARGEVVVDHPRSCHGYFPPTSEGFWRHITGTFNGENRPGIIRMKCEEIIPSRIRELT